MRVCVVKSEELNNLCYVCIVILCKECVCVCMCAGMRECVVKTRGIITIMLQSMCLHVCRVTVVLYTIAVAIACMFVCVYVLANFTQLITIR